MKKLTQHDIDTFQPGDTYYHHAIVKHVWHTEGVRYVARNGEAYWLLDELAFYLASKSFTDATKQDARIGEMHFWTLAVHEDHSATLQAEVDQGCEPFYKKLIPLTDFSLPLLRIWASYDGSHWILYLPSEH